MKLYKEVLIASAEQAEALPVDTIAFLPGTFYDVPTVDLAAVKSGGNSWDYTTDDEQMTDAQMVGWTALVLIEAEEEWTVGHESPSWAPGTEEWAREFQTHEPRRRLFRRSTTPWEEAQ